MTELTADNMSRTTLMRRVNIGELWSNLSFRANLYLVIAIGVLSLVGLGVFSSWELAKYHHHLDTILVSLDTEAKDNPRITAYKQEMLDDLRQTQMEFLGAVILASLLLSTICLSIIRRITMPLADLVSSTERLGDGDLSARINTVGIGELGLVSRTLNDMAATLAKNAKKINDTTISLNAMSDEIYNSVTRQSAGATQQSAVVGRISETFDKIKELATRTLAETNRLSNSADHALEASDRGRNAAETARRTMDDINDRMTAIADVIRQMEQRTEQIGHITSTVKNLAQQSKMLALNAAIEAAKAGQSGKGFAVVAMEMRQLAEQSEASTGEVGGILQQIRQVAEQAVTATDEGTRMVGQGGHSVDMLNSLMEEQLSLFKETFQASQDIATSVREESGHLADADQGMEEIRQVVKENVAATRRAEQTAGEISLLTNTIRRAVARYKLR